MLPEFFGFRCFFKPITALAACIFIELQLGTALLIQHNGDIKHFVSAALRGCNRSGDNARRSSGELGSALFGRTNDDFFPPDIVVMLLVFDVIFVDVELGVFEPLLVRELFKLVLFGNAQPGLYDCVVFDAPICKTKHSFQRTKHFNSMGLCVHNQRNSPG